MLAVVTGGSSGIGLAVQRRLNALDVRTLDLSTRFGVDVTDASVVANAYADLREAPELLVASAGVIAPGPAFPDNSLTDWRRVIDVNVTGAAIVAAEHSRRLISAGKPGRIVLVGSPSGRRPSLENLAYGVSKAAVAALGIGLARGLEPYGIRVYVYCPSHVDTPMLRARGFNDLDARGLLSADEVAVDIVHLLLDDNSLDGQVIYAGREVRMKQE